MSEPICEGCGLITDREVYVRVRLLNGGLLLCSPCLTELNGKNPELARLRQQLADKDQVLNRTDVEIDDLKEDLAERDALLREAMPWVPSTELRDRIRDALGEKQS